MAKLDPPDGTTPLSPSKFLSPAARRALAEADERRRRAEVAARDAAKATEIGGRDGPEPTRYGDWEVKGIVSDF
jgi:hypothetical protein